MGHKNLISPWPTYEEDDIRLVTEVLRSGRVNYWTGSEGRNFESEFAKYVSCEHAIALANGSLALSSAYLALGIGEGDEVITTPRTFIATSASLLLLKAIPVFADVDKDSGAITPETIAPLITSRTKAISVVHLGGWPADMQAICKLARDYGLFVIEDCSQAHGASIAGRSVGSFGDIGTWSFCQDKIMTTGGEGGMVTTNNKEYWEKIWSFKDHGKSWQKVYETIHKPGFRWLHDSFGSNFRLTEMQSSIGRNQLKKLNEWNKLRTRNSNIISKLLQDLPLIRVPLPPEGIKNAWYKFYAYIIPSNLKEGWTRDRILYEISTSGFPALSGSCSEIYLEKCFLDKSFLPFKRLPIARLLGETSLMFLVHPTITEDQMNIYGEAIRKVLLKACR